nr:ribosomal protein S16 [Ochna serrulata]WEG37881.1 ribosomal protein S16 [Ochna serrulata]
MVKLCLKQWGRKELFIESLQLMFDLEGKEEIFGKGVFMVR